MRIVRISTRITITALAVAVTACGLVRVGPDEALVEAADVGEAPSSLGGPPSCSYYGEVSREG